MLDAIDFSQDMPELLQLDFFERTQIEQVISNCEHVNEQGHTVCNVKVSVWVEDHILIYFSAVISVSFFLCRFVFSVLFLPSCSQLLHRVLVAEVNALQGVAAIGQRPLLMEVS